MIEHHAQMARALGEQPGLPEAVLEGLGAAYEQWDGKGWPGLLSGEGVPLVSRIAQLAEFVEVAHRVSSDAYQGRDGGLFDLVLDGAVERAVGDGER